MLNRRDFMKQTAVLSAATLTGYAAAQPATKPLRCALLGINHAHGVDLLKMAQKSEQWELAGVCEPDAAVRTAYSQRREMKDVPWLSLDEALQDDSIDMIAVESDVPRLLDFAEQAVQANKHIHLDKPAGFDLPRFKAILDDAEERKLLVQMGYMYRYNPGFDIIRQALQENWLGDIYSIHASMCTNWNAEKRQKMLYHHGGAMLELGCHLIDIILVMMGPPENVTSFMRSDGPFEDGFADNTMAVFEYEKAMVTVETAGMEPRAFDKRRFKICGTEGSMILEPLEPPILNVCLKKAQGDFKAGRSVHELPDLHRHLRDLDDFARCIRGEATFAYSKEHDYNVQRTLLRACGDTTV